MALSPLLEQRRFPRNTVPSPIEGSISVAGRTYDVSMADYTLEGIGIRVPKSALPQFNREKLVELTLAEHLFAGSVRHIRPETRDAVYVGISLEAAPEGEVTFSNEDAGWDLVDRAETIAEIFSDLAFKGPECLIHLRQIGGEADLFVRETDVDRFVAEVVTTRRGTLRPGRAAVRFELFQTSHAFEGDLRVISDSVAEISMPKQIARLLRRETFRVANGSNNTSVSVTFGIPIIGLQETTWSAFDFSEHGIAILDREGKLLLPRRFPLGRVTIQTSKGLTVHADATVSGARWNSKENGYLVGLEIAISNAEELTGWHNTILEARYPTLSLTYNDEDHPEIWNLFERSGYLDLKPREAFTHVFDATKSTWRKLHNAGTKFSKRVLIRKDNRVVGHLQMDRIYPETWCVHHLAIDPSANRTIAKDVYSAMTDVISAAEANYVFSLTQASKPWNQRNYYDFVSQYRFPEHHMLKTYQVYEADTSKECQLHDEPGVSIRLASKYDLRRILRCLELYIPKLERLGAGLVDDELDLAGLAAMLAPFGLERSREFLIAELGGELVAFARLETGSAGTNIFGLLDMLYVHVLPSAKDSATAITETLLSKALARYRTLGKQDVIVLLENSNVDYYSQRGLQYIWDGVLWVAQRVATRRYYAYTQMLYGHLLLSREKIRSRRNKN